jgi:pyruvate kinase
MMADINKTRIVCTVGPASASPRILEDMIRAGMNVARLNFSHGDSDSHAATTKYIRAAVLAVGRQVVILGDLPGPKIRIGNLQEEPLWLRAGDALMLVMSMNGRLCGIAVLGWPPGNGELGAHSCPSREIHK